MKEIESNEIYVMLPVPENTVSLKIEANLINDNNEIIKAVKDISPSEFRQARKDFVENIGDDWDEEYVLTEEGRKWLNSKMIEVE